MIVPDIRHAFPLSIKAPAGGKVREFAVFESIWNAGTDYSVRGTLSDERIEPMGGRVGMIQRE
jgi:hypothetical protein